MNFVTYINDLTDIENSPLCCEFILSTKEFSRFGTLSIEDKKTREILEFAKKRGIKIVFEWDIISTQNEFNKKIELFKKNRLDGIHSFRVQDLGVAYWLFKNVDASMQFIAETGFQNLLSLSSIKNFFGKKLERIILSQELSKDRLKEYVEKLEIPVEILLVGRILLFYSPRNLLSAEGLNLETQASSEESPHKGFSLLENSHGTFMFNPKDFFLIDVADEVKKTGVSFFRLDLRHFKSKKAFLKKSIEAFKNGTKEQREELKKEYPNKVIRGFFNINKSDVLFRRLKNNRTQRTDDAFVGEVIDIGNKKHLGIYVKSNNITFGQSLRLKTPDGKEKILTVDSLKNSKGEDVEMFIPGEIAFVKYISGISVKTQIYELF